jgi:hypothetical protein
MLRNEMRKYSVEFSRCFTENFMIIFNEFATKMVLRFRRNSMKL